MKRLLRISFNQAIFSFIPILSWILLGLFLDKNLSNVFSLTYPIQFIWSVLISIFGIGANIHKEKDKNSNAVLSGMTIGIIVGVIIFGFLLINIENYIDFMHMDYAIYKEFAIYSVIQIFIQLVFGLVMEKLYFEGREKKANLYMILLNIINFVLLIGLTLITKNKSIIVIYTLLGISIFTFVITIKEYRKFKFNINIIKCLKYESVDISEEILFFLTYLFGYNHALSFGDEYVSALNFVALITDTQWDAYGAIDKVAKIDISKDNFNYKYHLKNAYKLIGIILASIFILLILLYNHYNLSLSIVIIYLAVEVTNFIVEPLYSLKICYLQLTDNYELKVTTNKIVATSLRTITSFLNSPFCTAIGQTFAMVEQFIVINIIFYKNFKINKRGEIVTKEKEA